MAHHARYSFEKGTKAVPVALEKSQVAALCWRKGKRGKEVLLITSRRSGRWIIPKGWPMDGKRDFEAAGQEAWEEAGVRPEKLKKKPLGTFRYIKELKNGQAVPIRTSVYKLKVKKLAKKYPELGQRRRQWLPPKQAARLVREPELRALLKSL